MFSTSGTGLPAGKHCNIIDDCASSIQVGADGKAEVVINNYEEPILAVCIGCDGTPGTGTPPTRTSPASTPPTSVGTGPTPPPGQVKRTVIFIQKQTNPGQDMFIRGGIDATQSPGCVDITSSCSIPFEVWSLVSTPSLFSI